MRIIYFVGLATMFAGCCSNFSKSLPSRPVALTGHYHLGDNGGYNLFLDLLPSGRYDVRWRGCLGVYGTARGAWEVIDDKIILSPSKETGKMKRYMRELNIVLHEGHAVFVQDLQDDYYLKYGPNESVAFHRYTKE